MIRVELLLQDKFRKLIDHPGIREWIDENGEWRNDMHNHSGFGTITDEDLKGIDYKYKIRREYTGVSSRGVFIYDGDYVIETTILGQRGPFEVKMTDLGWNVGNRNDVLYDVTGNKYV